MSETPTVESTGVSSSALQDVRTSSPQTTPDDLFEMYEQIDKADESSETKQDAPKQETKPVVPKDPNKLEKIKPEPIQEAKSDTTEIKDTPKIIEGIKGKNGDQEIVIPEETIITDKINGKDVNFRVKDAIRAFKAQETFNRNADSRIGYITTREKQLAEKEQHFSDSLKQIGELAQAGDPIGIIHFIAETKGGDPVELEKAMLETFGKAHDMFLKMTPEQKAKYFAERKASILEKKLSSIQEQTTWNQGKQLLESKVDDYCKKYGLTKEGFVGLYKHIAESLVGEGKTFSDPGDIQPEDVIKFHLDLQMFEKVQKALAKLDPALARNDEIVDRAFMFVKDEHDFTEDDIVDVLMQARQRLMPKSVEDLSAKVNTLNGKGFPLKTSTQNGQANSKTEDIEDELYDEWFTSRRR